MGSPFTHKKLRSSGVECYMHTTAAQNLLTYIYYNLFDNYVYFAYNVNLFLTSQPTEFTNETNENTM